MKPRNELDEDYLNEQIARMESYVVDGRDPNGKRINKIYAKGDEYLIYDMDDPSPIESFRVLVDTREEADMEPILRYAEVKDEFDRFKSVAYKASVDSSYKHRAAHAITVAINGDTEKARNLLKNIQDEITKEYREKIYGRVLYFSGAATVVFIFSLVSVIAYAFRNHEIVSTNSGIFQYLIGVTFAGYGGLLSVSIRIKELFTEKALAYWMFFAYGAERLALSILGGIAAITLLKAELIFSSFMEGTSAVFVALSVCYVSGFSETLIPNALRKLEGQSSDDSRA